MNTVLVGTLAIDWYCAAHDTPVDWYDEPTYQLRYRRTVVGWWNVYHTAEDGRTHAVNVSPERFLAVFPDVSPLAKLGCAEVYEMDMLELGFPAEVII